MMREMIKWRKEDKNEGREGEWKKRVMMREMTKWRNKEWRRKGKVEEKGKDERDDQVEER